MRPDIRVVIVCLAVVVGAGACSLARAPLQAVQGSAGSSASPTVSASEPAEALAPPGTRSERTTAPPVLEAQALRDVLLSLARPNLTPGVRRDFGIVASWVQAFPRLEFTNYALKATVGSVPVFANLLAPAAPAGDDNPYLIAFSVLDAKGRCAAGILSGYPVPVMVTTVTVAGPTACTAIDGARGAGFDLR